MGFAVIAANRVDRRGAAFTLMLSKTLLIEITSEAA